MALSHSPRSAYTTKKAWSALTNDMLCIPLSMYPSFPLCTLSLCIPLSLSPYPYISLLIPLFITINISLSICLFPYPSLYPQRFALNKWDNV